MRPRFLAIAGVVAASMAAAVPAMAQTDDPESVAAKLAYVAGIYPERTYYCRASPLDAGTSETSILFDFQLDGTGPVDARMEVRGQVRGRPVSARMRWRGTAGPAENNPDEAVIVLTEVYDYDADPLPDGAEWSDPSGDVITLKIERFLTVGGREYILNGTQETEFGTNALRCLDGNRI